MQSVVLTAPRAMQLSKREKPQLLYGNEVLIKIKYVGVCGSDIHYYTEGKIGSQVVEYPFLVGHECSGKVVSVGSDVKRVAPGDLVAIDPAVHCGSCSQCLSGRPHTCLNNHFLGCPGQLDGCLTEFIVMPDFCCYPVTDLMDAEEAALLEPFSIGVYAVSLAGGNAGSARSAILGAGPIGLSIMQKLLSAGAKNIGVSDPLAYRLDKAMEMGASWVMNPDKDPLAENFQKYVPDGLEVVYDASGSQSAIDDALKILQPGGKLVLVGIPPDARYIFDMDLMRRKEITVINVRRQNNAMEEAIRLVAEKRVNLKQMVTHYFQLSKTAVAFDLVSRYEDGVLKAMIFV